jgi:hypothetical protein
MAVFSSFPWDLLYGDAKFTVWLLIITGGIPPVVYALYRNRG